MEEIKWTLDNQTFDDISDSNQNLFNLHPYLIEEIQETFKHFDSNGDGSISADELRNTVNSY